MEIGFTARRERDGVGYSYMPSVRGILVVAVPWGRRDRQADRCEVLAALGAGGTLINLARGSVVDEPAPTAMPNVVLYTHHASGTVETRDGMAGLVNENLRPTSPDFPP